MFSVKIEPISVSQSTTLRWGGSDIKAEFAADGDLGTESSTTCSNGKLHWFEMKFDAVYCFDEVVMVLRLNGNAYRMQNTEVTVVNTKSESEELCGILKVKGVWTDEAQTYTIPCNLKCGDEIKLSNYNCIHIRELSAFQTG